MCFRLRFVLEFLSFFFFSFAKFLHCRLEPSYRQRFSVGRFWFLNAVFELFFRNYLRFVLSRHLLSDVCINKYLIFKFNLIFCSYGGEEICWAVTFSMVKKTVKFIYVLYSCISCWIKDISLLPVLYVSKTESFFFLVIMRSGYLSSRIYACHWYVFWNMISTNNHKLHFVKCGFVDLKHFFFLLFTFM